MGCHWSHASCLPILSSPSIFQLVVISSGISSPSSTKQFLRWSPKQVNACHCTGRCRGEPERAMFFPSYSGSAKYEVGRAVVANRISAITRLSLPRRRT